MGLLKKIGQVAGETVGKVVGGTLDIVGEATGNETLKEVSKGVDSVISATGKVVGGLADATVVAAYGVVSQDGEKIKEGLGEAAASSGVAVSAAGSVVKHSAIGVVKLARHVAKNRSEESSKSESPNS